MIAITGASGLLGANLVLSATERSEKVFAFSCNHPIGPWNVPCLRVDLTDETETLRALGGAEPRIVVHTAALTNVDLCEENPDLAYRMNVAMAKHVARAAAQAKARLILISTDSVFDGSRGNYSESDAPNPLNVYAKTKLAAESAVQEEAECCIMRTNFFGWSRYPHHSLSEWIVSKLEARAPVPGFTDVIFSPILVNDLCDLIWDVLERGCCGIFHLAGADACSKFEFALAVAKVFGFESDRVQRATLESARLKAPRPRNTSLSTRRASEALGRKMPDLISGLERFRKLGSSDFISRLRAQ
ncbi:MAG: SDR family oxidoreductase [Verrucomicrobia bacterium]|nr:SDR family oxidoreductase [Verrucomicrobiota bacterium]